MQIATLDASIGRESGPTRVAEEGPEFEGKPLFLLRAPKRLNGPEQAPRATKASGASSDGLRFVSKHYAPDGIAGGASALGQSERRRGPQIQLWTISASFAKTSRASSLSSKAVLKFRLEERAEPIALAVKMDVGAGVERGIFGQ